ncbi:MAG: heme biosynthesis protein HemY [Rhodocyclaceae bacterium]|nr:heme biosynthesis protein HemY [Rhodocyclaceae bacterium]
MRALFWLLAIAALGVAAAIAGRLTEGYVLWVLPPWRVEMSFNLFVVLWLLGWAAIYAVARAIGALAALPREVADYRRRRQLEKAWTVVIESLRLHWEGRYSHALKWLAALPHGAEEPEKAGPMRELSALADFIGMQSAYALRDAARSEEWRERAARHDGEGWRAARLSQQLRAALETHETAMARAALSQMTAAERRRLVNLRLALRLALEERDWQEVLRLSLVLAKHHALNEEQALPIRLKAAHGLLEECPSERERLLALWRGFDERLKAEPSLVALAARKLAGLGACADSAELIEACLEARWAPELLEIYADCAGGDLLRRLSHAEKWLAEHPRDGRLLMALGRLCAERELWGKARSFFEASLAVEASPRAHLLLARLLDRLGETEEANRHYRLAASSSGLEASAKE